MGRKDPYEVLGVNRGASLDEIKKAYKTKAREYHPDKNKNDPDSTEKFKDVQEAFELLKDKKKRANYDRFGYMDGGNGGGGGPEDFFKEFFNGFSSQMPGGASRASPFPTVRSVLSFDINCTLSELYTGTIKKVKLRRTSTTLKRSPETIIEINIPPGLPGGAHFLFRGEGDEIGNTGTAQDIRFVIKESQHPNFTRKGYHLMTKVQITLVEALCGGIIEIDILGIKKLKVTLDGLTTVRPGHKLVIPGEGMPSSGAGRPTGDLIIDFDILFPQRLDETQRSKLQEILGPSYQGSKL